MKTRHLTGAALAVTGVLALPAAALAHPSVYTDTAKIIPSGAPTPATQAGLTDQIRHVAGNHGFTMVLRESNGATAHGVLDYSLVPSAYRNQAGYEPGAPGTRTRLLSEADTGAQAHDVCTGVPELDAEAAVLAWQGTDPFYNYVPFQKASAGLEDDPAAWIKVVKERTGVDLTTVASTSAACNGLGGTLQPADQIQTTAAALSAGVTEPFTKLIDELKAQVKHLTTALTTVTGEKAESERLRKLAVPPALATVGKLSRARFAAQGGTFGLTGPAGQSVQVRVLVSKATAKALRLRFRVLARGTGTLDGAGKAAVAVKPTAGAKGLRGARRPTDVIVETTASGTTTSTVRTVW